MQPVTTDQALSTPVPASPPVTHAPHRLTLKRLLPQTQVSSHLSIVFEPDRMQEFKSMLRAFEATGGMLRGDELAELLRKRRQGAMPLPASWIVGHNVLGLHWHGEWWVPLFQFQLSDMSLRSQVLQVVCELAPAFDTWSLVQWFALPNAWLHDRQPCDVMLDDAPAVLHAARADRFVAMG